MKIKPVFGQAASMVNLFCDIRQMPDTEFNSFVKALTEYRIRSAIFEEIGHEAHEEPGDTDRH